MQKEGYKIKEKITNHIVNTKKEKIDKNELKYTKKNRINLKKNIIKFILKFILIINIPHMIINKTYLRKLETSSEITIKINSNGTQSIFYSENYRCPDEIYLNGNIIGEGVCIVNLESEENIIKMNGLNKI